MGLWSKLKDSQARAEQRAYYGAHSVRDGVYKYLPDGKFKSVSKSVQGAVAEFSSGSDRSRPTLTRIGAGAIIAGPVGAIAGAMFKKELSKNYVTVLFPDSDMVIIEGPSNDELKMRKFAADVNRLAAG